MQSKWSRRQFVTGAGKVGAGVVVLVGAGYGGYSWPRASASSDKASSGKKDAKTASNTSTKDQRGVKAFASRPDLNPPDVTVSRAHASAAMADNGPRYFFVAPKGYHGSGPGTQGPMIVDREGHLIWFKPTPGKQSVPMDFQVQQYRGKPVLTWWEGLSEKGHGEGRGVILDTSYKQVATVQAGNGLKVDLHEFNLTSKGTALISAYKETTGDLTAVGGKAKGDLLAGYVQEIDIATGKVLFEWNSLDHVDISESKAEFDAKKKVPYDYFHINSIAETEDGNLLVSARNTWCLYKISRDSGKIIWRMGGKKSDFTIDSDAQYEWQHHARMHSGNRITVFDNASSPPEAPESRGLLLSVDMAQHKVSLVRAYTHPARLLADNQGSVQILDDGRVCVGWGAQPYFSLFSQNGELLLDGRLPANEQSYRAMMFDWTGNPSDQPVIKVGSNPARGATVYASWNGATQVDRWQVLAGKKASDLRPVSTAMWAGFETAIAVSADGPYFAVAALDEKGQRLGVSKPAKASA